MPRPGITAGVCLVLAAAPAAHAAQPARTIAAPSGQTYDQFSLAVDVGLRGAAVASWTVASPRERVQVATRARRGARFGRPVTLGPGRAGRVALPAAGGRATAAWLDDGRLRLAAQNARGRWAAQAVPPGLPTGDGLRVAGLEVRGDGTGVLALEVRETTRWRVEVLRRSRAGDWRRDAGLAIPESAAGRAVVDGTGAVTAVWLAVGRDTAELRVAESTAGGGWASAQTIARPGSGTTLAEPQVVAGPRGHVAILAGAMTQQGADAGARVIWRAPRARWRLSRPTRATSIGIGAGGQVWAGLLDGSSRRRSVVLMRLDAAGAWRRQEVVRSAGGTLPVIGGPGVGVLWNGSPLVWWVADGGADRADRWFVAVRGASGWGARRPLAETDGAVEMAVGPSQGLALFVAPTSGGRVVAVDLAP